MKTHKVKQGECLSSIAFDNGFFWRTIWRHELNVPLRKKRKNPNVLYPGDIVKVPDLREKEEGVALDRRHTFRLNGVPARLDLEFRFAGKPRAKVPFRLDVEGKVTEGETDERGRISVAISPTAKQGKITVGVDQDERTYELDLGALDPVDENSGLQARLNNLGFLCGEETGEMNEATTEALKQFQASAGLPVTGKADAETLERLDARHAGGR